MALCTGQVFMTAVELKSGIVMIEPYRFPFIKIMATGTGIIFMGIKLPVVDIRVTFQATAIQCSKFLNHRSNRIRLEMALLAG